MERLAVDGEAQRTWPPGCGVCGIKKRKDQPKMKRDYSRQWVKEMKSKRPRRLVVTHITSEFDADVGNGRAELERRRMCDAAAPDAEKGA